MGGYIGARAGSLSTTTVANVQDVTATDTTPEVTIINNTHEDTDGGREGKVIFKGQQSGGEESTLAEIQSSHDGTADDEKGDLIFKTNDGNDALAPTERLRINSAGDVLVSSPDPSLTITNTTHEDTDGGRESTIVFKGEQSGGELSTLAEIEASHDGTADDEKGDLIFKTNDGNDGVAPTERMRIDSSGNVGIGTTTPDASLDIESATPIIRLKDTDTGSYGEVSASSGDGNIFIKADEGNATAASGIRFHVDGSHVGRWDDSGNLVVGKTNTTFATQGVALRTNRVQATSDGAVALELRRNTNDGDIFTFYREGQLSGKIFVGSRPSFIADNGSSGGGLMPTSIDFRPTDRNGTITDNAYDLGAASIGRFDDINATNPSIVTSDEREKQQIASLTDAEIAAAKSLSKLFKTFKWNSAVETKGDKARTHSGVIAQQIQTAMSDAGLDAGDYAFFINTVWWETRTDIPAIEADEEKGIQAQNARVDIQDYYTEEEAPEGAVKKTRMGIRYTELLSFIGAATEQRLTSIEARLTALEG